MTSSPAIFPAATPPRPPASDAAPRPLARGWLWLVFAVALLARSPGFSNGFVNYDDPEVRADVAGKGPLDFLTGPTYYAYKPVYGLSLWLDRVLFGDSPLGGHVVNGLLFALSVALAALVLHALLRRPFVAVGAALLLATHPVHTENVAWVAERKDVLSLALVLLAHLAYRRRRAEAPGGVSLLAPVLLLLGGLAKGTVWTYAGVIALDEMLSGALGGRAGVARAPGALRRLLPVLVVAVGGVALDAWFGAAYGPGAVEHPASLVELAAAAASVHARYVLSLVWPAGLSVDYPVDPAGSWASPASLVGAALLVAALAGLFVGIVRRRPLLAIACGLWVAGLAPVNDLWPKTSILRADRYLLIPAIGLYALVAAGIARLGRAREVALAAVVVALGVLAAGRAKVFASSDALWTDAIAKEPTSALAFVNRAADAAERGDPARAERDAAEGARLALAAKRPELALRARLIRSLVLLQLAAKAPDRAAERMDGALAEAKAAVALADVVERTPWLKGDPRELRADAFSAVGRALETRGRAATDAKSSGEDLTAAVAAYRRAVEVDPRSFEAWTNLGNLLASTGAEARLAEAADALARALALKPDHEPTVLQRLTVLYKLHRDAEAKALFDEASARFGASRALRRLSAKLEAETASDPDGADRKLAELWRSDRSDVETATLLHALRTARALEAIGRARTTRAKAEVDAAVLAYDGVLEVAPRDADAQIGAGDALFLGGRFAAAKERYERAFALAPDSAWIKNLVARAALLEALELAHAGREDDAAAVLAKVVRAAPPRLDLGFATLDAEVARLAPAADVVLGAVGGPDATIARALLVGAALFVGGDEGAAEAAFRRGSSILGSAPPAGSRLEALDDMSRILRAVVRGRGADLAGARADLESVRARHPDDALVVHHLLLLGRLEASARGQIAAAAQDAEGVAAAKAKEEEVLAAAERLADSNPPWPGPGLLAAEMRIQRGDFLAALKRLGPLAERFPLDTAVRRGVAAIYQAQMLEGGDRTMLLGQAREALTRAKQIDPRDPRTALDTSQLYRLAGDLETAARNALRAASVEPIPGPAARALCAIEVERGRKALENHELEKAADFAASAKKADASSAAPWVLEGDVAVTRSDLAKALVAFLRAREIDPTSVEAVRALADCRRRRGGAYFAWKIGHPRPRERDGAAPDPKAVEEWDRLNALALAQAIKEYEASLRLEPDGPDADAARERIEQLRRQDPAHRRQSLEQAKKDFAAGEAERLAEHFVAASAKYREAVEAWSDFLPGWMRIAEMAVVIGSERDVEGLRAVDVLRDLDARRQYPEPDLYAGEIWARRARAGGEGAADAARRAKASLARFLERARGLGAPQATNVLRAEKLLRDLGGAR